VKDTSHLHIELVACSIENSPLAYPLGALCILSALKGQSDIASRTTIGITQYLADTHTPLQAAKAMAKKKPDMVGLSIYLYNRSWFDSFITQFARLSPQTLLFAGGAEVTANGAAMLCDEITFLTVGEGEESTVMAIGQWLAHQPLEGPGILTREHRTRIPSHPLDLARLPSPLLSGLVDPRNYQGILWEMTRGCPFHCAFCFESKGERSVRTYPFERIEKELEFLVANEVKHVFVLDPTFNMDKPRTVRILELLRDNAPQDMEFTFEVRAELLDETVVELFSSVCCSLQIGLQSSDTDVLATINRRFDPQVFAGKMALLNSHNVVFGLDLIIGLPGDTLAKFRKSLDFAIDQKPSNIDIFPLALLPGTKLAEEAAAFGIRHQTESPYLILESPTMGPADIAQALELKDACDRFYTKGAAAMWFHAACRGAQLSPCAFLRLFSDYAKTKNLSDETDIYDIQDQFVRALFGKLGKKALLPALLSYMELHQGIAYLQETDEIPVVHLSYDPQELAALDTESIDSFIKHHKAFEGGRDFTICGGNGQYFFESVG